VSCRDSLVDQVCMTFKEASVAQLPRAALEASDSSTLPQLLALSRTSLENITEILISLSLGLHVGVIDQVGVKDVGSRDLGERVDVQTLILLERLERELMLKIVHMGGSLLDPLPLPLTTEIRERLTSIVHDLMRVLDQRVEARIHFNLNGFLVSLADLPHLVAGLDVLDEEAGVEGVHDLQQAQG